MNDSHAELCERPQQSHLLGRDLARAQKGDRIVAVSRLDGSEAGRHLGERSVPVHRVPAAVLTQEERRGRAIIGVKDAQGFPALRAGHAEVDRVFGRRREVNGLAVAEVDGQAATGRTETADHPRGRVGRLGGGNLPESESARGALQLARQPAVAGVDEREGTAQ